MVGLLAPSGDTEASNVLGASRLGTARHRPGPEDQPSPSGDARAPVFLSDAGATFPSATATWEEQSCSVVSTYPSHPGHMRVVGTSAACPGGPALVGVCREPRPHLSGGGRDSLWFGQRTTRDSGLAGGPRVACSPLEVVGTLPVSSTGVSKPVRRVGVPGPGGGAAGQGTMGLGDALWRDVTAALSAVTAATITRSCSGRALRWPAPLQM